MKSLYSEQELEEVALMVKSRWNEVATKKICKKVKPYRLDNALGDITLKELLQAIDNYWEMVKDKEYFFNYAFDMESFLRNSSKYTDNSQHYKEYLAFKERQSEGRLISFTLNRVLLDKVNKKLNGSKTIIALIVELLEGWVKNE